MSQILEPYFDKSEAFTLRGQLCLNPTHACGRSSPTS